MTNYNELSDFEINGLVAAKTKSIGDWTQANGLTFIHEYTQPAGLCFGWKEFNPCNSWSDAGPIITASKINIQFDKYADGVVSATGFVHGQKYEHENPLRAAMIVFLMMREGEE